MQRYCKDDRLGDASSAASASICGSHPYVFVPALYPGSLSHFLFFMCMVRGNEPKYKAKSDQLLTPRALFLAPINLDRSLYPTILKWHMHRQLANCIIYDRSDTGRSKLFL